MNFDNIKGMNSALKRECCEAESFARVKPAVAAFHARKALEIFHADILKKNGLPTDGPLWQIIKVCDRIQNNSKQIKEDIAHIRKYGNHAVHNSNTFLNIDAATKKNIALTVEVIEKLYGVIAKAHGCSIPFCEDKIPFEHYEIIRKVKKYDAELLSDDYNYFVRVGSEYYYLQCLSIGSTLRLDDRREAADERIRNHRTRTSYISKPQTAVHLSEESDRKIVVYPDVYSDSFLLSELEKGLSLSSAISIALDLAEALLEMKGLEMNHRNLCPGCVLVDPTGDDQYDAYLTNMQTSKIQKNDATVYDILPTFWTKNAFIPQVLLDHPEIIDRDFENWEKVDVFGVCKILLFCLNPKKCASCAEDLFSYGFSFSDEFLYLFEAIFNVDAEFSEIPHLEELKGLLSDELKKS